MKNVSLLFLLLSLSFSSMQGADEVKLLCDESNENFLERLPFKMNIPEDFVVHQPKGTDWWLFGKRCALVDLDKQLTQAPPVFYSALSGVIRINISQNTAQTGPKTFSVSNSEIKKTLSQLGSKKIRILELSWGEYPVKVVEAMRNGVPFRMALVGLNCEGLVCCVHYIFPKGQKSYESDLTIWNHLLSTTKPRLERNGKASPSN